MTTAISRLSREECRHTKHGPAFSEWKVLIGPSDWEDHATGQEGAERYRTQNLPNCTSCTGVYELGVAVSLRQTGRDSSKLEPDFIIPVYLGKSDNVRNRMQQYGRDGAHLENGNSNSRFCDSNEILAQRYPGLFREIFSKGFFIVYRWAPMENIQDAEKTESRLLDKFDYAWNKGSNGERRRNDILKELKRMPKSAPILAKLHRFPQKREGIKNKVYKVPSLENGLDFYSHLETNGLLQRIFKFGRSQPRLVVRSCVDENSSNICGIALGHGVICKRPPTEGNKWCIEHKGMKVNGSTSKLLTDGKSTPIVDEHSFNEDCTHVCGVALDDGSCCTNKPLQGNQRCLEHKGRRICNSISEKMKDKKENYVYGPVLGYHNQEHVSSSEVVKHCVESVICGVDQDNGTFCTRQPPTGRKRCEEHKGMRIKGTISMSFKEEIPSVFEGNSIKEGQNGLFLPSVFCEKSSPTFGAALQNGSFCSREVTEGNKRCWQHQSLKTSPGSSSVSDSKDCDCSSQFSSFSSVYENLSPTCGATLQNGSSCSRKPTEGNKRCWQHYGMRVNSSPESSNNSFSTVYEHLSPTCGATLQNGSSCSRKPTEGNKRCWQHYGMRVNSSPGSSNNWISYGYSSGYASCDSVCGAPCRNGSSCGRKVTGGGRCWQHGG